MKILDTNVIDQPCTDTCESTGIKITYNIGDIRVNGVSGYFAQEKTIGNWVDIVHTILNHNGIGAMQRKKIAHLTTGNYPSIDFPGCKNTEFQKQVVDAIEKYINNNFDFLIKSE